MNWNQYKPNGENLLLNDIITEELFERQRRMKNILSFPENNKGQNDAQQILCEAIK